MRLEKRVDPEIAAVIVVDVQNDFCHPEGVCAAHGSDVTAAVEMVPRLEKLLARAREAGVPLIFIQTTHDETTDSFVWLSRHGGDEPERSESSTCRTGTWGADFYKVSPQPGEPVVIKHRYSAFAGTDLDVVLNTLGRKSLLFTGVATNVCVESTLRDALFADYHVTLIEDCCAAYSPDAHEATVKNVASMFGLVANSETVIELWSKVPAFSRSR